MARGEESPAQAEIHISTMAGKAISFQTPHTLPTIKKTLTPTCNNVLYFANDSPHCKVGKALIKANLSQFKHVEVKLRQTDKLKIIQLFYTETYRDFLFRENYKVTFK